MKWIKFGINPVKKVTGAELYVSIMQRISVLPVIFIFLASGYPAVMTRNGFAAFLFNMGISCLPRIEAFALSFIFRNTLKEVIVSASLPIIALIFGLVAKKLLRGEHRTARTARYVFAALIAADLILRLLPFRFNIIFGIAPSIIGFIVRLGCLALVLLDLRADNAERETASIS